VLTGEGGDELFGGYRRYVAEQAAGAYQKLPHFLRDGIFPALMGAVPRVRRTKRILRTLPISDPVARYPAWLEVFSPDMRNELLRPLLQAEIGAYDPAWPYARYYHHSLNGGYSLDHLNRLMYVDVKTWLADAYLEKLDKATMAFSIEGRLPFLDHRLVELAFQIPAHYKIRGLSTKRILKEALQGVLPDEVLRKRKHGFAVPNDPWFRGKMGDFVFETLLDSRASARGYFDPSYIERLFRSHRDGKEVFDSQLWLLLNFELWNRAFIDP
jgi:asparagine synthase (glutamine-hydrolysing)